MQVHLINSKIKSDFDGYVFTENDLHPNSPFFKINNIAPESASVVNIIGLLEQSDYIRHIIKIADRILELNGVLNIKFFNFSFDSYCAPYRGYSSIMHELSITLKDRYRLSVKKINGFIYEISYIKCELTLPEDDSIDKWSFGLICGPKMQKRVTEIIINIENLKIPTYEILICGKYINEKKHKNILILDDNEFYNDERIPISRKKNHIIKNANYNNLVLFHDRFYFPLDWFKKMRDYGNYFDGICPKILDVETKSKRVQDWISTSLNHLQHKKIFPAKNIMSYNEWRPNWNLNGGHIMIKKNLIERVLFNPNLNWGECEDGDLCRRLDQDGFCLTFYNDLTIYSSTLRLKQSKNYPLIIKIVLKLKYKISLFLGFYNRRKIFKDFLKNV